MDILSQANKLIKSKEEKSLAENFYRTCVNLGIRWNFSTEITILCDKVERLLEG
jgi:hypothetical protein